MARCGASELGTLGGTFIFQADALDVWSSSHRLPEPLPVPAIALDTCADLCAGSRNCDDQSPGRVVLMKRQIHRENKR